MTELLTVEHATPPRPTAEQVDELAAKLALAIIASVDAEHILSIIEKEAIDLVILFGIVPPNAENSRILAGTYNELMVTIGNRITIDESRVQDLKEALEANGYSAIFANLFQQRVRHELVKDADKAILAAGMNKRLTEKVQALFGRCFDAQKKSPTLKVKKIVEKPTKKTRAKKGPVA